MDLENLNFKIDLEKYLSLYQTSDELLIRS